MHVRVSSGWVTLMPTLKTAFDKAKSSRLISKVVFPKVLAVREGMEAEHTDHALVELAGKELAVETGLDEANELVGELRLLFCRVPLGRLKVAGVEKFFHHNISRSKEHTLVRHVELRSRTFFRRFVVTKAQEDGLYELPPLFDVAARV